jgi:hypothetical protein
MQGYSAACPRDAADPFRNLCRRFRSGNDQLFPTDLSEACGTIAWPQLSAPVLRWGSQ